MSLIICKECGKEYSNKTEKCPECACPTEYNEEVEKDLSKNQNIINCIECGANYEINLNACPSCACPTEYNLNPEYKSNLELKPNPVFIQPEVAMDIDGGSRLDKDKLLSRFNGNKESDSNKKVEVEDEREKIKSSQDNNSSYSLKYLINPLQFDGRVGRIPYTIISIISTLIAVVCYYLLRYSAILGLIELPNYLMVLFAVIMGIFILLDASITVRRLHDIGRSGKYIILLIPPIISTLFWIALMFIKGTEGTNKY